MCCDTEVSEHMHFRTCMFGALRITSDEIRQPDHIASLAVNRQSIALSGHDMDDVLMPLTRFVARIGEFTCRVTLLRDSGAEFSSVFVPLPL